MKARTTMSWVYEAVNQLGLRWEITTQPFYVGEIHGFFQFIEEEI